MAQTCIFGISGNSGAGKTALILALIPQLQERGLRVGVIKHLPHEPSQDKPDSDTALLAGPADAVVACSEYPCPHLAVPVAADLRTAVKRLDDICDIILVEGFKHLPFDRVWLLHPSEQAPPPDVPNVLAALAPGDNLPEQTLALMESLLAENRRERDT